MKFAMTVATVVAEFSGPTEEELGPKNMSHYHDYEAKARLTPDGKIAVTVTVGEANRGEAHKHQNFEQTFDDPSALQFELDVPKQGGEEGHGHLIRVEFEKPLFGAQGDDEEEDEPEDGEEGGDDEASDDDEEEEDESKDKPKPKAKGKKAADKEEENRESDDAPKFRKSAALIIQKFAQHPQDGVGQLICDDGAGFLAYRGPNDPNHLKHCPVRDADIAFRAPIFPQNLRINPATGLTEEQIKKLLTDDGLLPQEIYRTGTFKHWLYGEVKGTRDTLEEMRENYENGVVPQWIILNLTHEHARGGAGRLRRVEIKPKKYGYVNSSNVREIHDGYSLWGYTELWPWGYREILVDFKWPYISAEIHRKYRQSEVFQTDDGDDGSRDDEMADIFGKVTHFNVLSGYAACIDPFITAMNAVAARSRIQNEQAKIFAACGGSRDRALEVLLKVAQQRGLSV